jgi:two-component system sensor histidine kinase EvgS
VEEGAVTLSGNPLLWRSVVDACHAALGQALPEVKPHKLVASMASHARILIAEDHPINREVISRQLDRLGYEHTIVEDGMQALQALEGAHYDLLISDCHMPVLDGYALAKRIRDKEKGGKLHLPIVALSASALPEEVQRCREAGMDEFLAKPVQLNELDAMLSRCLDGIAPSAPPKAAPSNTVVDSRLEMLMGVFGSKRQVRKMLCGLLDATRRDLLVLDQALSDGDNEQQRLILHRIHGALRLLGDTFVSDGDNAKKRDDLVRHLDTLEVLLDELGSDETDGEGTSD